MVVKAGGGDWSIVTEAMPCAGVAAAAGVDTPEKGVRRHLSPQGPYRG
jgi:hypothetical protein